MEEEYETVILVKPEVFVFKIPPRASNRGYRAADWKLDAPDWTGRMRVVTIGNKCVIKLEDKTSGELFAKGPVDKYPGIAVESVLDSSRYFVLRIEDDNGRAAFIGIGFGDRGDSFDLNVALQEHFKWVQTTEEIEKEAGVAETKPSLDLGFKAGQTITINMNIGKKSGGSKPRPKSATSGVLPGLLPPPPGGARSTSPSAVPKTSPAASFRTSEVPTHGKSPIGAASAVDDSLLLDFDAPVSMQTSSPAPSIPNTVENDLLG